MSPSSPLAAVALWFRDGRPASGAVGPGLAMGQVSALAAMAFCYFLAPALAWVYPCVAVGWYLALALPAATTGPLGMAGQRLLDTSPGRHDLPGYPRFVLRVAGAYLVVFAAPALVASVLPAPMGQRSSEPWVAVAILLACSATLVAAVSLAGRARKRLAWCLVLAGAVLALGGGLSLSTLPGLPGVSSGSAD